MPQKFHGPDVTRGAARPLRAPCFSPRPALRPQIAAVASPGRSPGRGRRGRMSDCEFGYVQALARDYLCHVLQRPRARPGPDRVSRLLRAVASAVQSDAERTLRPSLDDLDVASVEAARAVFQAVVRQEFADGVVNWGRLVTVFALQGILAKKLLRARDAPDPDLDPDRDRDLDADTSEEIARFVAEFITSQAGDWIRRNGGWEHGFVQKFEPRPGWLAFLGAAGQVLLCVLRQLP